MVLVLLRQAGTLPNGSTAHAFATESEEQLRAIGARDPWHFDR